MTTYWSGWDRSVSASVPCSRVLLNKWRIWVYCWATFSCWRFSQWIAPLSRWLLHLTHALINFSQSREPLDVKSSDLTVVTRLISDHFWRSETDPKVSFQVECGTLAQSHFPDIYREFESLQAQVRQAAHDYIISPQAGSVPLEVRNIEVRGCKQTPLWPGFKCPFTGLDLPVCSR